MSEIIEKTISNEIKMKSIECIGPEKINFQKILNNIINALDIKRFLVPMPLFIAKLFATFLNSVMKRWAFID